MTRPSRTRQTVGTAGRPLPGRCGARAAAFVVALALAACGPGGFPADAGRSNLAAVQVPGAAPPATPPDQCWADHVTPAVIETVTEQELVPPARASEDASAAARDVFRTVTRQKMVADRTLVWFPVPCEAALTPDFVATLQRALKARGLYGLPLTGRMDAGTLAAVRRFQAPRGLDSDRLSLAAARELGLIAEDPDLIK